MVSAIVIDHLLMLIIFFYSIDQQYWWPRKSLSHNYTRIWRHPYIIISLQSSFLAIHFFTWHEFFLFLYLLFAHTEYGIQKIQELEGDVAAKNLLLSDLRCDWRLTAAAAVVKKRNMKEITLYHTIQFHTESCFVLLD